MKSSASELGLIVSQKILRAEVRKVWRECDLAHSLTANAKRQDKMFILT